MPDPGQAGCAADGHVLTRAFPSRSYFGPGDRADGRLTRRDQIVTVTGPHDVGLSGRGRQERLQDLHHAGDEGVPVVGCGSPMAPHVGVHPPLQC
jgi:hypothetical protein